MFHEGKCLTRILQLNQECTSENPKHSIRRKAWSQSTLPVNLGGLGMKLASEVALPAILLSQMPQVQL